MNIHNWKFDFNKAFPMHVFKYRSNIDDELHWHDYYEIALCINGSGHMQFEDRCYTSETGDIFIINNRDRHVAIPDEGLTLEYIFLIFLPEMFVRTTNYTDTEFLTVFRYESHSFDHKIPNNHTSAKFLEQIMHDILCTYRSDDTMRELKLDILTRTLLLKLNEYYNSNLNERTQYRAIDKRIHASLNYILDNFNKRITVAELASNVQLSASHYRHLFQQELGITFGEYLAKIRINFVLEQLTTTNYTIQTIIEMAGISNKSHFYQQFKETIGLTPAEYRRHYGAKESKIKGFSCVDGTIFRW